MARLHKGQITKELPRTFPASEHCKIREKRASKKALNFLVLLCTFRNLFQEIWKLVSRPKYALSSRKYALTPRKYALTSRKYALTS